MYHILFLAKDLTGYKNLMRLVTESHNHFYRKPRCDIEMIRRYSKGLICTTACIAGILSGDNYEKDIKDLSDIFHDDLYIEIQPHTFKLQQEYNKKVSAMGFKTITTLDSHYVYKEDSKYHKIWLDIKEGSDYYSTPTYYLMDTNEIVKYMKQSVSLGTIYNSFDTINEIIDKCNVEIPFGEQHYPVFCDDPESYVRKRCNEGYKRLGVEKWATKKEHITQVNSEIDMLRKSNYLNYMCIIDDMIQYCKRNGIRTGLGRGSVTGSDVAYFMGITNIDPLKYGLIFERFCNPERVTPGDVDTDIQPSRRSDVIDYVKSKYGEVYQVRTSEYIKYKSALGKVRKPFNKTVDEIKIIKKKYPTLDDLPESDMKDVVSHFIGHIIGYSKHASALIVCPEDICNFSSVEYQTSDNNKSIDHVVSFDFHDCEAMGLLKLDMLGLQHLDDIDKIIKNTGIDYGHIPDDDQDTIDMLNNGHTEGVFQSQSTGFTKIIKDMKFKNGIDFIAANALCRPGTLDSGTTDEYIKRRKGLSKVSYIDDKLEDTLKDTYGLILFQEQVMTCARKLCGYSLGQADNVRRIIGRKIQSEMESCIADMKEKAKSICTPIEAVQEFTNVVEKSASYLFNKNHSAAYGITAWRSAYIKCHYPAEYHAAIINAKNNDKDNIALYVKSAKGLGVNVLPPLLGTPVCTVIDSSTIRLGTNCIKGVGSIDDPIGNDIESIFTQYNKKQLESLIYAGALNLKEERGYLIGLIEPFKEYIKKKQYYISKINKWESDVKYSDEVKNRNIGKWKDKLKKLSIGAVKTEVFDNIQKEVEYIGVAFSDPLEGYDNHIANGKTVVAEYVTDYKKLKDKNGNPMAFINTLSGKRYVMFHRYIVTLEPNKRYLLGLSYSHGKVTDIVNSVREIRRKDGL